MIDIAAMRASPDFRGLSVAEQQRAMREALAENGSPGGVQSVGAAVSPTALSRQTLTPEAFSGQVGIDPQMLRETIGPMAAVGLSLLGGPLAGATRLPLSVTEPLTSMAGEGARQLITGARSVGDLLVSGVWPVAVRGLLAGGKAAVQMVAKRLPGAAAGLHEAAIQEAQTLVQTLKPSELDALQQAAKAFDTVQVPMQALNKMAQDLAAEQAQLAPALRSGSLTRIVEGIQGLMETTNSQALPVRQVRDNLEEIGVRIGELRRQQGVGMTKSTQLYNGLRRVYRTLLDAFDALPGDAPAVLQAERTALRQNFAAQDLAEILAKPNVVVTRQIDGLTSLNARALNTAWNSAKDSKFLQESFTPLQRAEVEAFITAALRLPPLPTPQGVAAGSKRVLGAVAAGGGIGFLAGGPTGAAAGSAIAAIAPPIIAKAMMSESGRRILQTMLREGPVLSPVGLELLSSISRQAVVPALPGGSVDVTPGVLRGGGTATPTSP